MDQHAHPLSGIQLGLADKVDVAVKLHAQRLRDSAAKNDDAGVRRSHASCYPERVAVALKANALAVAVNAVAVNAVAVNAVAVN